MFLDFPASETVANKFVVYKPPSIWNFVVAAQIKRALPIFPSAGYCSHLL
jgi:hypothetical protein